MIKKKENEPGQKGQARLSVCAACSVLFVIDESDGCNAVCGQINCRLPFRKSASNSGSDGGKMQDLYAQLDCAYCVRTSFIIIKTQLSCFVNFFGMRNIALPKLLVAYNLKK